MPAAAFSKCLSSSEAVAAHCSLPSFCFHRAWADLCHPDWGVALWYPYLPHHSCLNAPFPFATSMLLPLLPLQKDKPYYHCPNPYLWVISSLVIRFHFPQVCNVLVEIWVTCDLSKSMLQAFPWPALICYFSLTFVLHTEWQSAELLADFPQTCTHRQKSFREYKNLQTFLKQDI